MKRFLIMVAMCVSSVSLCAQAKIKFEKQMVNFGTFTNDSLQHAEFVFTNTGDKPLVILQAFASCGCTTPQYPKDPIAPGGKGKVSVKYNGKSQFPGHFKKAVTVRSNAVNKLVRIYIEGTMQKK